MPIRMEEDESSKSSKQRPIRNASNRGGSSFSGGNILFSLLPLLLKRPKLLLILAVIGVGLYFFMGPQQSQQLASTVMSSFNKGATLDPKVFDEAEVFEPLSKEGNTLPERVTLEKFCPTAMNQGQQGSCVGWGSAYAARTILQSAASGRSPNDVAFSPAFLYNQIKLDGCQGSYIYRAMENMTQVGSLPFTNFGYTDESCERTPTSGELYQAATYKMKGSNRLTKSGDDQSIDMLAMKQNLAQGAPVVIGMMVGGSFMKPMEGKKCWIPTEEDYQMSGFGGHCMCVIGYDDYYEGGAFQLMNSWGTTWGEAGKAWVRYTDFAYFTKEAYGVYP
ncbi:MAG: C1 family peptidase, partial [Cytophagaceae bacterium]|nr:C1 family peptidase [Cytophagaceae bacterium]